MVPGATGINCDASNAVNEGFSNGYETAVKAANDMDKNFEVNMQYQVIWFQLNIPYLSSLSEV